MTSTESLDLALEAGLRYVEAGAPGYRRMRRGRGFSYLNGDGQPVAKPTKDWIEGLVIPPAWNEVWVSTDRRGHILATGIDKAGRKQYIYHPDWEELRDAVKFDRLGAFGDGVSRLRRTVDADLRAHGLPRRRVVALAVAVLDLTLIRVGTPRYVAENESFGLTTLTCQHISVDGKHVHLEFAGKGGLDRQLVFSDRRISGLVAKCQELAGQTLFSYESESGDVASVTSTDVNTYLAETLGGQFTAKDFRTWGASSVVTGELALDTTSDPAEALRAAIDVAADRLGNTRAVLRDSYLHPAVVVAYEGGLLPDIWRRSRSSKWVQREESALRRVLEEQREPS